MGYDPVVAMGHIAKFTRLSLGRRSRLPEEIQIEVTNRCNLDCRMCPRTRWGMPLEDMVWTVFERVLDQLPSGVRVVTLTGWGEPLLHPRLFDMARAIRERRPGALVRYTTNGTFLDDTHQRETLASGVGQVNLSVDLFPAGGDPEGAGHPESRKVLERFSELARRRDASGARIDLYLQAVLIARSEARLEELVRFAAENRLQGVHLARLQSMHGESVSRMSFEEERGFLRAARAIGRRWKVPVWSAIDHSLPMKLAGRFDTLCLRTDNYVYVDLLGKATPCCSLWHVKLGDLSTQTLREIWNSSAWDDFFRKQVEVCGSCDALKHRSLSHPHPNPLPPHEGEGEDVGILDSLSPRAGGEGRVRGS